MKNDLAEGLRMATEAEVDAILDAERISAEPVRIPIRNDGGILFEFMPLVSRAQYEAARQQAAKDAKEVIRAKKGGAGEAFLQFRELKEDKVASAMFLCACMTGYYAGWEQKRSEAPTGELVFSLEPVGPLLGRWRKVNWLRFARDMALRFDTVEAAFLRMESNSADSFDAEEIIEEKKA